MSEIIDVPFPRASSRRLISFLTFHISIFFSASLVPFALMAAVRFLSIGRAAVRAADRSTIVRPRREELCLLTKGRECYPSAEMSTSISVEAGVLEGLVEVISCWPTQTF